MNTGPSHLIPSTDFCQSFANVQHSDHLECMVISINDILFEGAFFKAVSSLRDRDAFSYIAKQRDEKNLKIEVKFSLEFCFQFFKIPEVPFRDFTLYH